MLHERTPKTSPAGWPGWYCRVYDRSENTERADSSTEFGPWRRRLEQVHPHLLYESLRYPKSGAEHIYACPSEDGGTIVSAISEHR